METKSPFVFGPTVSDVAFTNRKREQVAVKIPELMKDHSWYVQQLSHYTWHMTGEEASPQELLHALTELIYANAPLYQRETEGLSPTQLNLLKAIVQKETQLTSARVMQEYRLGTPRNVSKNRKVLLNNDIIDLINGQYELLDPAFELWFLKTFFGKEFGVD